jgi:hypothetical protein
VRESERSEVFDCVGGRKLRGKRRGGRKTAPAHRLPLPTTILCALVSPLDLRTLHLHLHLTVILNSEHAHPAKWRGKPCELLAHTPPPLSPYRTHRSSSGAIGSIWALVNDLKETRVMQSSGSHKISGDDAQDDVGTTSSLARTSLPLRASPLCFCVSPCYARQFRQVVRGRHARRFTYLCCIYLI